MTDPNCPSQPSAAALVAPPRRFGLTHSQYGYGWWFDFGKRVRWHSRKATSRMWPSLHKGADENCNRAVTLVLWPLGHLDVWWEPHWRTDLDGPCETCRAEFRAEGCCDWCGSRPCHCRTQRGDHEPAENGPSEEVNQDAIQRPAP